MDIAKPTDEKLRHFCLVLGVSIDKEVRVIDGKEYAIAQDLGDDTIFFNPLVDANDAVELQEAGGIEVMFNKEGSVENNNQWFGVVNQKHAVPARNIIEAVSMAAYAITTGQFADLTDEPKVDIIGANESSKIILPGGGRF